MIDTMRETILTLAEAARHLPRRKAGRKTHVTTLYRWTVSGCRGVVLEHIQIGATRCTSAEALHRFYDRLTPAGEAREKRRGAWLDQASLSSSIPPLCPT